MNMGRGFEMNRLETIISLLVIDGGEMLRREINATIEHSCNRLDKIAVPSVKYWLQVYVQGMDENDAVSYTHLTLPTTPYV